MRISILQAKGFHLLQFKINQIYMGKKIIIYLFFLWPNKFSFIYLNLADNHRRKLEGQGGGGGGGIRPSSLRTGQYNNFATPVFLDCFLIEHIVF